MKVSGFQISLTTQHLPAGIDLFFNEGLVYGRLNVCISLLPLAELFMKPDETNLWMKKKMAKKPVTIICCTIIIFQYGALGFFSIQQPALQWYETAGRILSMGLLCGTFGINVAHELGHRVNRYEQVMARKGTVCPLHFICTFY